MHDIAGSETRGKSARAEPEIGRVGLPGSKIGPGDIKQMSHASRRRDIDPPKRRSSLCRAASSDLRSTGSFASTPRADPRGIDVVQVVFDQPGASKRECDDPADAAEHDPLAFPPDRAFRSCRNEPAA